MSLDVFERMPVRLTGELDRRKALADKRIQYHVGFLDDCLRAILPNDLVLLGAPSGLGKTDLAMNIATSNAMNGKQVHYFALEAEEEELERRTKFATLSRMAHENRHPDRTDLNYADWMLGACEHIVGDFNAAADAKILKLLGRMQTFYRGAKFDAKDLQSWLLKIHKDTDLIVVDHLHYVDAETDVNEAQALGDTVKTVRDISLRIGKPIILIAHLRKRDRGSRALVPSLDDFHGSSNITKICTQAITLERASSIEAPHWFQSPTFMTVLKDRRAGACPFVAVANYDKRTKGYEPHYTLGKLIKGGSEWEELTHYDCPPWAKHHKPMLNASPPAATP